MGRCVRDVVWELTTCGKHQEATGLYSDWDGKPQKREALGSECHTLKDTPNVVWRKDCEGKVGGRKSTWKPVEIIQTEDDIGLHQNVCHEGGEKLSPLEIK